jgi:glyoxylase-like metal-dependent hydrolase (beta-lactamase superfamily II)
MAIERWAVGDFTITSVLEEQSERLPPEMFFPMATRAEMVRHRWLVPDFADERGRISMRVQAFVVEGRGRRVLVDPCVGNGKRLQIAHWNERSWPFLERLTEAGFEPEKIDTVVHTHLHADHVGWDTRRLDGAWVPTFAKARHLYTAAELEWCRRETNPGTAGVYTESVAPILEAGLADIVASDADLGDGLRLEPTPGHSPGHVSLWIESRGEAALVTGDILHHPVQCAEPAWRYIADHDADEARATRIRMLATAAERRALVLGTHFSNRPAGRVVADGDVFRFAPSR